MNWWCLPFICIRLYWENKIAFTQVKVEFTKKVEFVKIGEFTSALPAAVEVVTGSLPQVWEFGDRKIRKSHMHKFLIQLETGNK